MKALVLALLAIPPIVAMTDAISFHVHDRNNGAIVSSGLKREYLLYVPRSYDPSRPAPLVISLHGAGGWPKQQMEVSRWNRLADRDGFIVVYPSAFEGGGPRVWSESGRDVRFMSDLIDRLESSYNIDRRRIFANGFSNGGGMSFALSCTLSDRIAAVGLVGAAQAVPFSWCKDRTPVPMIDFHGTADPDVPYNGGQSWLAPGPFPHVQKFAANWARRNRCAPSAIDSTVAPDVVRREYASCAGDASVVLYTIRGGGHTWPGGGELPEWFVGPTSRSIDATETMWAFFRAHPLQR